MQSRVPLYSIRKPRRRFATHAAGILDEEDLRFAWDEVCQWELPAPVADNMTMLLEICMCNWAEVRLHFEYPGDHYGEEFELMSEEDQMACQYRLGLENYLWERIGRAIRDMWSGRLFVTVDVGEETIEIVSVGRDPFPLPPAYLDPYLPY